MIRRNVLRELLNEDKPTIGTHVHSIWPGMVEVIGQSGTMDYIEFSAEYAPYDLHSLENFGRAIDLFDHMSAMMKIEQESRTYLAVRAVGSGIQNLLFADIRTPEDAAAAGAGMRRDVAYVVGPGSADYVESLEQGVVMLMIEKRSAVERLEEVLSVGGVDMVQFGPADYAMSLGYPGQFDHPEVKEAERHTIETAIKMGIRPRAEIESHEEAAAYVEMGVKDFCIGADVQVIYDYCREQGGSLAKTLGR